MHPEAYLGFFCSLDDPYTCPKICGRRGQGKGRVRGPWLILAYFFHTCNVGMSCYPTLWERRYIIRYHGPVWTTLLGVPTRTVTVLPVVICWTMLKAVSYLLPCIYRAFAMNGQSSDGCFVKLPLYAQFYSALPYKTWEMKKCDRSRSVQTHECGFRTPRRVWLRKILGGRGSHSHPRTGLSLVGIKLSYNFCPPILDHPSLWKLLRAWTDCARFLGSNWTSNT